MAPNWRERPPARRQTGARALARDSVRFARPEFALQGDQSVLISSNLCQRDGIPGTIHANGQVANVNTGIETRCLGIHPHGEKRLLADHHLTVSVHLFHNNRRDVSYRDSHDAIGQFWNYRENRHLCQNHCVSGNSATVRAAPNSRPPRTQHWEDPRYDEEHLPLGEAETETQASSQ